MAETERAKPDLKEIQRKLTARASYQKMIAAKEAGKPICVASAGIPNEVMYAMDVYPIFPESLAAISAGIGKAGPFFDEARDRGYTNTVCSYTRCGLGIASQSLDGGGGAFLACPDDAVRSDPVVHQDDGLPGKRTHIHAAGDHL